MANLRIVADNAADRCTIATSTTAGALIASRLLTDDKTEVARATGTSWTITGTTTVTEQAACVHLPFCNLSPTATIRVRLYSDTAGTTLVLDTNVLQPGALACPAPARILRGWTAAQAASAYANGGGSHARIWFAATAFRRYVVDIIDTANLQGYIEAARIVVGPYWSPEFNATNAPLQFVDSTVLERNAAGGQMAQAGFIYRQLMVDLSCMAGHDRSALAAILANSRAYPIVLSMFPGIADLARERDSCIYGRRPDDSLIEYAAMYGSKIALEEI